MPENGFAVLKVKAKGRKDLATVVGRTAAVAPGEKLEASGQWVVDRERGLQFKAETIATAPPASAAGIERYLASGLVKGIGPGTAKKLVEAFGKDTLRVLDGEPERLRDGRPACRPSAQRLVREGWAAQQGFRDVLVFLTEHGLGPARAAKVQKTLGPKAIDLIARESLPAVARGQGHRFPHGRPVRAQPRARAARIRPASPPACSRRCRKAPATAIAACRAASCSSGRRGSSTSTRASSTRRPPACSRAKAMIGDTIDGEPAYLPAAPVEGRGGTSRSG